jgi:hypothetical protein
VFKKFVVLLVMNSLLYSSLAHSATYTAKDFDIEEMKGVYHASCQDIRPAFLDYLKKSDYPEKRLRHLAIVKEGHQQTIEMYKELYEDAKLTSTVSSVLFSASILLLTRGLFKFSIAGTPSSLAFRSVVNSLIGKPINAFMPKLFEIEGPFMATVAIGKILTTATAMAAAGAGYFYIVFINPAAKLLMAGDDSSASQYANRLKVLSKSYDEGYKYIDKSIQEVDLDYSHLANGLSLGKKASKATEALYGLALAKQRLIESEEAFLTDVIAKGKECK